MRRITDHYPDHNKIRLGISEGVILDKPTIVTTILGSCVSITFYCHTKEIGAIFHAILPVMPEKEKNLPSPNPFKYVDSSIHHIVYSLYRRGIKQSQIEAKVFGGAQAFFNGQIKPGPTNIKIALEVLAAHKIKIVATDVGGDRGRNLVFVSNCGEVYVKNHKNNLFEVMKGRMNK